MKNVKIIFVIFGLVFIINSFSSYSDWVRYPDVENQTFNTNYYSNNYTYNNNYSNYSYYTNYYNISNETIWSIVNNGTFLTSYIDTNVTTQCIGDNIPLGNGSCKPITEIQSITGKETLTITNSGLNTTSVLNKNVYRFVITPTDLLASYRFEANETSTGIVISKNRMSHTGIWDIRHNGYTIAGDSITVNIFDSTATSYKIEVYYR